MRSLTRSARNKSITATVIVANTPVLIDRGVKRKGSGLGREWLTRVY